MAAKNTADLFNIMLKASAGLAAFGVLQASIYTVQPGHRALIFDRLAGGIQEKVKTEGLNFLIPIKQIPIIFDVRITPTLIRAETLSKDQQHISLSVRALYRPEEDKLPRIYKSLGMEYDEKVLPSVGNEIMKAVVAKYDAAELITQRENVSQQIRERLSKRAKSFGILVEDVAITHLSFSKEFINAIEMKQVAEQIAERQQHLVDKAKHEKLAEVILAEGETEAARFISEAMSLGNEYLELKKIEAAREIAETLARNKNVVYVPQRGNFLLNLNDNNSNAMPNRK